MTTIPRCKNCKSTVFTLAKNTRSGVYTGYDVLKCMVCGSMDEPEYVRAYEGEADLRNEQKKRNDTVYRYESLLQEWIDLWKLKIGK